MAIESSHRVARRTPRQVIEGYVKASSERNEALDALVREKLPVFDVDQGWSRYISQPRRYPEIAKGLEKMGYEDPFSFSGGPAARLASVLCPVIKRDITKVAVAIVLLNAELSFANVFMRDPFNEYGKAVNILKYSYLFSRVMNDSGISSGVITMANTVGGKRKCGHDTLLKAPAFNWIMIGSEYFKFSFGDAPFFSALSAPEKGTLDLYACSQEEAYEDTPRQVLSYHHYIKGMSLHNFDGKDRPEIELSKAYQLSPDNGEYRFTIEIMAASWLHDRFFNIRYSFDDYVAGRMDKKERSDFEKLLGEHPSVRIAFELEYGRKRDKEWREFLADKP